MTNASLELIAYDFVSHHPRGGQEHTTISVEPQKRGAVDLASVIARTSLVKKVLSNALGRPFMPLGFHTPQVFARDFFYISKLLSLARANTKVLHQTLVFHQ